MRFDWDRLGKAQREISKKIGEKMKAAKKEGKTEDCEVRYSLYLLYLYRKRRRKLIRSINRWKK